MKETRKVGNSSSGKVTAKELSHRSGLAYSTIDHWSERGLLKFQRLNGRTRVYELEENLLRCRFIVKMQSRQEGCSLSSVREMIEDGQHRDTQS